MLNYNIWNYYILQVRFGDLLMRQVLNSYK